MEGGSRDQVLCFIHVPKTAGTVVRSVVYVNNPGRLVKPVPNVFKGGGGMSTSGLAELPDRAQELELEGVGALHGHHPLGIRSYLEPAFPDRAFRYITMLRDPVERSISHFFHVRDVQDEDDSQPPGGLRPLPAGVSFEGAIVMGYLHDNVETRMLSGDPEPFGDVDDAMLARAKRNVRETMTLVGITERLDESLVLAKQRLGLRSLLVNFSQRVNAGRPRGPEVPPHLRSAAERYNRYDAQLYRFAVAEFECAPERRGLDFHAEVAALRAARDGVEGDLPPQMFKGSEREWRLLVRYRADLLRLEAKRAERDIRANAATATGSGSRLSAVMDSLRRSRLGQWAHA
jgi:hypothetical protein